MISYSNQQLLVSHTLNHYLPLELTKMSSWEASQRRLLLTKVFGRHSTTRLGFCYFCQSWLCHSHFMSLKESGIRWKMVAISRMMVCIQTMLKRHRREDYNNVHTALLMSMSTMLEGNLPSEWFQRRSFRARKILLFYWIIFCFIMTTVYS